jgi:hypothetical protein
MLLTTEEGNSRALRARTANRGAKPPSLRTIACRVRGPGRVIEFVLATQAQCSSATATAGEADHPKGVVEGAQASTRRKSFRDVQTFSLAGFSLQ